MRVRTKLRIWRNLRFNLISIIKLSHRLFHRDVHSENYCYDFENSKQVFRGISNLTIPIGLTANL